MIRITVNTRRPKSAAAKACFEDLPALLAPLGVQVTQQDWDYRSQPTHIFLMSEDVTAADIRSARELAPGAKIGICDPKSARRKLVAQVDFLLVGSWEQRESFLDLNHQIHVHPMFPLFGAPISTPARSEASGGGARKVIVGYHGNLVHLRAGFKTLTPALERLASEVDFEFWAIYNQSALGKWLLGRPRGVQLKDIQWTPEIYSEVLPSVDVGVVPNDIPRITEMSWSPLRYFSRRAFLEDREDYRQRYKYSSNVGRHVAFGLLGIPIVADFFPSAAGLVFASSGGILAHSSMGWYVALKQLITDQEARLAMGERLRVYCLDQFSPEARGRSLLDFLSSVTAHEPQVGVPSPSSLHLPIGFVQERAQYWSHLLRTRSWQ